MQTFYRLNPHLNARPKASSMFDLAKAVDGRILQGQHWGDDYLALPQDSCSLETVECLMREEGIFFERVASLPGHHLWQLV
jgi:hypothetical protein